MIQLMFQTDPFDTMINYSHDVYDSDDKDDGDDFDYTYDYWLAIITVIVMIF